MIIVCGQTVKTGSDNRKGKWTYVVVRRRHTRLGQPELELADDGRDDRAELEVRKLLADAPVAASAKRLVRALGALADKSEAKVDLGALGVVVLLVRLRGGAFGVRPARRVPLGRVLPEHRVDLADRGGREHDVALGNDVAAVFGGCGERGRDDDVLADATHDAVDGRVNAEGLTNDGIEDGQLLEFLELWGAPRTVGLTEVLNLFLVQSLTAGAVSLLDTYTNRQGTHATSGRSAI